MVRGRFMMLMFCLLRVVLMAVMFVTMVLVVVLDSSIISTGDTSRCYQQNASSNNDHQEFREFFHFMSSSERVKYNVLINLPNRHPISIPLLSA